MENKISKAQNEIVINDLKKNFSDVKAVDGLNLEIRKGELFGFLGPNGAGKTTTIRILCGLLAPTSGTVHIAGFDVNREMSQIKELIGVCPQETAAFKFLSGKENIELFGSLNGMNKKIIQRRTAELMQLNGLSEFGERKVKGYSGGMLRQLNLLMALISDPDILFLDEPTVGMDVRARRRTWDHISSLKEQKKTIILTTHYIEEAQALSDRVGIIDYGELVALGSPMELMEKYDAKDLESVFLEITGRRIAEGS
ncbi:MAG: ATP-binding cassette domain-containing protein [Anaerolineaceae bacterium]|nr:ATP-binding cassette domain-containing protein [Anaerolineaceae bacterium]